MKTQDKMKTGLVNVAQFLFGTAHLATAITGEVISITEAALLRKQFVFTDKETGEVRNPTLSEYSNKRKHDSQTHVNEIKEVLKDPANKLAAYRKKVYATSN